MCACTLVLVCNKLNKNVRKPLTKIRQMMRLCLQSNEIITYHQRIEFSFLIYGTYYGLVLQQLLFPRKNCFKMTSILPLNLNFFYQKQENYSKTKGKKYKSGPAVHHT